MGIPDEIEAYIARRIAEGWSKETLKSDRYRLDAMARFLAQSGCRSVADVEPKTLDSLFRELADSGLKPNTLKNYFVAIRSFFLHLAEAGKILANPAREIGFAAHGEAGLPRPPLDEDDIAAILDNLPKATVIDLRNRLHLELLYGCGLRLGESIALDLGDCDLGAETVHVRLGKWHKERLLPMPGGVAGALRDYLALRRDLLRGPDHGALLLSKSGRRIEPTALKVCLDRINRDRGPRAPHVHPHLLRHSIAVHLLRGGADIRYIQEFLGHADLDTTKIYLMLVPERLKEDYDRAFPEIAVSA